MAPPSYKLIYFNVPALADPIKFLFSYGGIEFEDQTFEREEWPSLKPNTPFGQVPVLEHNGKQQHQSVAICRYVAKQVKLAGDNDWEALEIDAMVDTVTDFRSKIQAYHYSPDPRYKETLKETLFNETVPFYLHKFEDIVKKNKGYFVGGKLTWADIYFVGLLEYLDFMLGKDTVAETPNLKALKQKVLTTPGIKEHLANRPPCSF